MGDELRRIKVIPDHFEDLTSGLDSHHQRTPSASTSCWDLNHLGNSTPPTSHARSHQQVTSSPSHPSTDNSSSVGHGGLWTRRKLRSAASMLRLFSLRGLPFIGADDQEKVELSAVELESLKSELADLQEREAHLKAQLEQVDDVLRLARLSGYLSIRTRWAALPGEPPPIDDCEVDDWIPRFVVLQGPCLFFYHLCTDLSPQDSTLLSDVVEVGPLPSLERLDEMWHCFYVLTRYGLRYECSSVSRIQVDSWLRALRMDCKLEPDKTTSTDQTNNSNP